MKRTTGAPASHDDDERCTLRSLPLEIQLVAADILGRFTASLDGRIFDANAAFLAMCGYERADLATLRWTDLTPPEYAELDRRMIVECMKWGRRPPFEKEYLRKDGSRVPLLLAAVVIDDSASIGERHVLVYAIDLRAVSRKHYENWRDRELETVAESIPHIVWRTDAAGRNDYFNDAWYAYTGPSPEQSRGRGWMMPLHPDDVASATMAWQRAVRDETPYDVEFRIRSKTGAYEWFLTRATALRDRDGRITQFFGTCTNVDGQKRTAQQSAFFAALGDSIAGATTLQATLDVVTRALVERGYGDWAFVNRLDRDDAPVVGAVHHADRAKHELLLGALGRRYHRARLEYDVPRSSTQEPYCEADVPFIVAVAERLGPALASVELHERERRIAATFQNAVLPKSLPDFPGMTFEALYEAGQEEALVGGDWYDAFRLPDGRCVLSIGDVSGSGLSAATLMAEARQSMRGAAAVHADPVVMLDAADRVFARPDEDRFATAWVGIIDPVDFSFAYASAGHPGPLLRSPSGELESLRSGGLPLGLRRLADDAASYERSIEPGSVIVLFTDGLTEFNRDPIADQAKLERLVASLPCVTARSVRDGMLDRKGPHDDVALLVVDFAQRLSDFAPPQIYQWSFEAADEPAARAARSAFGAALAAHGVCEADVVLAELITSELLGNAVRHASGKLVMLLDMTGDAPVQHVIDSGSGFAHNSKLPLDAMSENGRGLYILSHVATEFSVSRPTAGSHARVVLPIRGTSHERRRLSLRQQPP